MQAAHGAAGFGVGIIPDRINAPTAGNTPLRSCWTLDWRGPAIHLGVRAHETAGRGPPDYAASGKAESAPSVRNKEIMLDDVGIITESA